MKNYDIACYIKVDGSGTANNSPIFSDLSVHRNHLIAIDDKNNVYSYGKYYRKETNDELIQQSRVNTFEGKCHSVFTGLEKMIVMKH
mmetsp:Transcript_10707/g.9660  ORF Transcript_10707/g.9660 Transcript_10707/m.9660 type:complete len:87 (-) Transcript_10707:67-327(-)